MEAYYEDFFPKEPKSLTAVLCKINFKKYKRFVMIWYHYITEIPKTFISFIFIWKRIEFVLTPAPEMK